MNIKNCNSKTIFFFISIFYAAANIIWWKLNTPVFPYDSSALHFNDIFESGWLFFNAPLITWIIKIMFYVFGKEYFDLIVIFVNYIFFLIALYYIYKLGVVLKDKETGIISIILFALVPAIYGMSRQYGGLEYHLITAITFNIYCLIRTNHFTNRKWSLIYGISIGLGMLIKDEFLAYFFIPFAYIIFCSFFENINKNKTANILLSVISACLTAGFHYFRQPIIQKVLTDFCKNPVETIFSFDNMRAMTTGLWENLLSPPIFIIFLAGLIWYLFKYKGSYKYLMLLWIFFPWLAIILMPHYKLPEYGAGFIPAMVLIASLYLSSIKQKYIKKTLISLLIVICSLQYLYFSYAADSSLFNLKYTYKNHTVKYFDLAYRNIIYKPSLGVQFKHLTNYLNTRYPNKSFYLLDRYSGDNQMLYTLFCLNDIPCVYNLDYFSGKIPDMVISIYKKSPHNVLLENYIPEDKFLYENVLIIQEDVNKNFQIIEDITNVYFFKVVILERINKDS